MSDALPEPSNVGPSAGGNIRASDGDREQVATVLSTAYAEGRLTREEHDERLDRVLTARTFDDLIPLTHDLVAAGPKAVVSPSAQPTSYTMEPARSDSSGDTMVAIFSGTTRKGKWRVKSRIQAMALFGGIDLDMTEAVFEGPTVEISGFWCFGGLDIKVPSGMEIRDQTVGIFGGTDISHVGDPVPGAPTLVVKGMTLFGGVAVKGPKPQKKRRGFGHSG